MARRPPHCGFTVEDSEQFGIGLHLHCGEAKSHAVQARQRYGTSLVGRLEALGVLGADVSLAHCVWLDDEEFRLVARRGATIVHNPASNLKLGSGVARVRRMRELGARWGFIDSPFHS